MLTALAALVLVAPQEPRFGGYPEQDALSYGLALDVDPAARRLEGTVRYRFRAEDALDRIRLDARRGPEWSVTFHDGGGRELRSTWSDEGVTVHLGPVAAGREVEFAARLRGTPPDGFYFAPSRYGDPLAFTDHYSIRARGWLPCEDHPGDRASFAVALSYPEGNAAVTSGVVREVGEAGEGGGAPARPGWVTRRSATENDIPPYMFAIVVGPYAELQEEGDPRLRPHLVYRQDVERARPALVHHARWIGLMEQAFGPMAYAKYLVVQCPTRWGGFEAPGNVQVSEALFDGPSRGVGTLAHELAHMWFGDAVGYAEWREVWLSEGFASYFGPWLHAQTGGPALVDSLARQRERWRGAFEGRTKAIRWGGFPHPDQALNANTYPKGAWVLHMLRGELGDEAFFGALRAYYRDHAGRSVVTADLVAAVERASGRELGWFFEQWLDRVGCPVLAVESRGGTAVVEQVQEGEPYRFQLKLAWTGEDGTPHRRVFEIRERRTELQLAPGEVRALVVDPDVELLFRAAR